MKTAIKNQNIIEINRNFNNYENLFNLIKDRQYYFKATTTTTTTIKLSTNIYLL